MKYRISLLLAASVLAGCAGQPSGRIAATQSRPDTAEAAAPAGPFSLTLAGYKRDLALRIAQANADRVFAGRPQALLRSVIVVKYGIDAKGNLTRSEILRSNHDRATESTALQSLRASAPFPKPASHLLHRGQVEITETWLFNNDGRFQLRTIAEPQMDS